MFLVPTAYTHPKGTFYISSYEIVLGQIGYAFTDSAQASFTMLPPLESEGVALIDLSVKVRVIDNPFVRVAVIGSMSGLLGLDEGNFVLGRFSGTTQLCFSRTCESSLNVSSSVLLGGPATFLSNGAGLIASVSKRVRLLLELDMLVPLGREVGEFNGLMTIPGIRFAWDHWGLDLGAAIPLSQATDPPAVPVIALTYRTL